MSKIGVSGILGNNFSIGDVTTNSQVKVYTLYGTTTDGSTTVYLTYDGTNYYVPTAPTSTYYTGIIFYVMVNGISADGYSASWMFKGSARRMAAASSIVVDNYITEKYYLNPNYTNNNVNIAADTSVGAIKVGVLGITGKNVRWTAEMMIVENVYG